MLSQGIEASGNSGLPVMKQLQRIVPKPANSNQRPKLDELNRFFALEADKVIDLLRPPIPPNFRQKKRP